MVRMGPGQAQCAQWDGFLIEFANVPGGFPPGGDAAWEGLPNNLCQCPHWGYLLKGKALVRLADGTEMTINGGDLYHCPPGHKLYAVEDFELIEFNPAGAMKGASIQAFSKNFESEEA
ncbi:MAG: hypothetical protein WB770_11080 [Acidimicrobiales bacterium]